MSLSLRYLLATLVFHGVLGGNDVYTHAEKNRLNVVLIICDDLNDYIEGMDGHPQAHTPAMRALAKSGVMFKHAYSNNPICAPSRATLFTGVYSHTARNVGFGRIEQNRVQSGVRMLPDLFRENGYVTGAAGKTFHFDAKHHWQTYKYGTDYGPIVWDGEKKIAHPNIPKPFSDIGRLDGGFGTLANVPFADDDNPLTGWATQGWRKVPKPWRYVTDEDRDPTPDEMVADWATGWISRRDKKQWPKPFFLTLGFIRPHTPMYAPQKYFDMFPIDEVQLPITKEGDVEDCGHHGVFGPNSKGRRFYRLLGESFDTVDKGLREYTQAYLACVASVDEQIGKVIEAIDNSRFKDNTIIIVTSDHGYNLGEKEWVFKNSPWEESTRIPLIVRAPGISKTNVIAEHPVSLIDIYPTLVDLCDLEGRTVVNEDGVPLEGYSFRAFLEKPDSSEWGGPASALTVINGGHAEGQSQEEFLRNQHWSLRTNRWRYVLYNDGNQELYDHRNDPHEWTNLANDPAFADVLDSIRDKLFRRIWPN